MKQSPFRSIPNLDILVASSLVHSFANTTSISSGAITSSPLQNTSSLSINTSCSSCVIAVDAGGLQQIFWFSHTWSVTLDTEYVTVTSFNGSNATAVTNTRTVLGDVQSLNTSDVPYIASLMSTLDNNVMYFNPNATLVRGTNGSVGTTSFPYGQAYAQVTAVGYRYMVPNTYCPMNMGIIAFDTKTCHCLMNTWFYVGLPVGGVSTSIYTLNRTYYEPLPSSQINEHNAGGADDINMLEPWDGQRFRTWLAEDEAFKSAFPNWEDCAFLNTGESPVTSRGFGRIEHSDSCAKSYSCWPSCCEASSCRLDGDCQYYCANCCGQYVSAAKTCSSASTAYSEAYSPCNLHTRTCAYCSTRGWSEW